MKTVAAREPQWLGWVKQLQAVAQNGLTYAGDSYDVERYQSIRRIAAEMLAAYTGADLPAIQTLLEGEVGYATPKLDVRGALFRQDTILLVRERSDGLWTLPGGWVDINEAPSDAVVREVYEEAGYRTRAVKLLALWDRNRHGHPPHAFHIYKLVFCCELVEPPADEQTGGLVPNLETDGVGFFRLDDLPPLSLTRVVPAQIARLFDHHGNPDLPTDFD